MKGHLPSPHGTNSRCNILLLFALFIFGASISMMARGTKISEKTEKVGDRLAVKSSPRSLDPSFVSCSKSNSEYNASVDSGVNDDELFEACNAAKQDHSPFVLLKDTLSLLGDVDEFGGQSDFPSLVSIVKKLMVLGVFEGAPGGPRFLTAVNLGARDGIGTMGNTDPTWPLFKDLGFDGIAVEGCSTYQRELERNFEGLKASPVISMIAPENVEQVIRGAGLKKVDVLKIDIDSWDCEVLPVVLREATFEIKVVLVEYNVKFPPPIKMNLATCPRSAFRSCARYHIYECSLQYMNDNVMVPAGYALVQIDWQNALYVHKSIAQLVGVPAQGINLDTAYKRGYAERKDRAKNMPWNHDIDHLLGSWQPSDLLQRALQYVREGHHQQDGSVLMGCGDTLHLVEYKQSSNIKLGDRVGEC